MRTLLSLAAIAVLGGCVDDTYDVRIEPTDEGFSRTLVVTPGEPGGSAPGANRIEPQELEDLAAIYDADGAGLQYERAFDERVPADLQGSGVLVHVDDPLGRLSIYVERPRGEHDVARSLDRLLSAQDLVIDLLMEDARDRFADHEWRDALVDAIDTDLRAELRTAGLEAWTSAYVLRSSTDAVEEEGVRLDDWRTVLGAEMLSRIALRQVELDRLEPRQALLLSLSAFAEVELPDAWLDDLIRGSLTPYVGAEAADVVVQSYLHSEQAVQLDVEDDPRIAAWEETWGGTLLPAAIGADRVLENYDVMTIRLSTPRPPLITNGEWIDFPGEVRWTFKAPADPASTAWAAPTAFAAWVTPDEEAQRRILGRLAIDGTELARHLIWTSSLEDHALQTWREVLGEIERAPAEERAAAISAAREAHPSIRTGITRVQRALREDDGATRED